MKEDQVIDELFTLLGQATSLCRDNVSYIYLSQFGRKIIPFCRKHFQTCGNPDARVDFLRWVIEYAKTDERVVDFAMDALCDRSSKVRRYACLVLACSQSARAIPELDRLSTSKKEPTATDAGNAATAIRKGNWTLFHQSDPPDRTYVLPMPHNPDYPEQADVNRYIRKACPKLVPELECIMGDLHNKWRLGE